MGADAQTRTKVLSTRLDVFTTRFLRCAPCSGRICQLEDAAMRRLVR